MSGDAHVRICERPGVQLPWATRLVAGFEHEDDSRRFLDALRERFGTFSLSLHPGKTRLIKFGRHAVNRRRTGTPRIASGRNVTGTEFCELGSRLISETRPARWGAVGGAE
jgi:hypothetical protein